MSEHGGAGGAGADSPLLPHCTGTRSRARTSFLNARVFAAYRPLSAPLCVQDIQFIINGPTPMLIMGDLNAKHKAWVSYSVSRAGKLLMEDTEIHEGRKIFDLPPFFHTWRKLLSMPYCVNYVPSSPCDRNNTDSIATT
ncbi:hypothetical protein EVAR_31783_1 [Eumeta japonica]|uniref:Endonuclease/exonuclease/phosphatase domain-containing protein n=1 Tax=Eumeta variegata TaxID=151549 RepID=A0A4C1W706_EUMVA|nr:hypothetical protein EVAR_31783_1 [Eumeta japonica]